MKMLVGVMVVAAAATSACAQDLPNPVVTSANEVVQRQAGFMVTAAEQMPEDKYSYRPTATQWTYGKIVSHVIQANYAVCGMLSGDGPGKGPLVVKDTTPKAELVSALKESFTTCQAAMEGLKDSSLGATITYFGGVKKPRARALIELTADLEDHYSQMAGYLRLNGMIPPSAKK